MTFLILGLIVFLGVHSIRIFADDWRTAQLKRIGELPWKGIYSLISIAGLGLIIWGFGLARQQQEVLWMAPVGMRHLTALLTLIAFVLLVAGYVPRNAIKSRVHHPVVLSGMVWAFAHLLSNGKLADVVLFGAFLGWAVVCFIAARKRDQIAGAQYAAGTTAGTLTTVVVGMTAWAGFAIWLHAALIGVRTMG